MWWLYPLVFCAELLWSFVSNKVNINVIKRKPLQAWLYGIVCAIMSWTVPAIVYLWTQDISYAIPSILGDSLGDFLSARKKPRTKKRKMMWLWAKTK